MRNENQIKRKLNELLMQKQAFESRLSGSQGSPNDNAAGGLASQIERLDDMIMLLEWVLNEPVGSYHA